MREILPRRVFPAIVLALGIIVLFPTPLMADVLLGWFFIMETSLVLLLIPVILIESVVLRIRLRLGWSRALGVSAVANLASTIAGIAALEGVYANRLPSFNIGETKGLFPFLVLLVPLFLVSWIIEYFIASRMLSPARKGSVVLTSRPASADSSPPLSSPVLHQPAPLGRVTLEASAAGLLVLVVIELSVYATPWIEELLLPSIMIAIIAVVLIQSAVLRRRLHIDWSTAMQISVVAILLAIPAVFVGSRITEIPLDFFNPVPGNVFYYVFYSASLVFYFVIPWIAVYVVARFMLRAERSPSTVASSIPAPQGSSPGASGSAQRPRTDLVQGMLEANVASYLFLAVIAGWLIVNDHGRGPSRQASAVGSLRTINTSEVAYSTTYTTGFSATLADLDGNAPVSNAGAAGLIDSVLGSGVKSNYRFVYTPGPKDENGVIKSYSITANPIKGSGNGNFYYTDQSGVIRMNNSQPATATDSPLAG